MQKLYMLYPSLKRMDLCTWNILKPSTKSHKNWAFERAIWTDESKFKEFVSRSRTFVRRPVTVAYRNINHLFQRIVIHRKLFTREKSTLSNLIESNRINFDWVCMRHSSNRVTRRLFRYIIEFYKQNNNRNVTATTRVSSF